MRVLIILTVMGLWLGAAAAEENRQFFFQTGGEAGLRLGMRQNLLRSLDENEGGIGLVWGPIGLRGSLLLPMDDFQNRFALDPQLLDPRGYDSSIDLVFFPFERSKFMFRPYLFYQIGNAPPGSGEELFGGLPGER